TVGGSYTVRVAVVDAGGATGTASGTATVLDPPPVATGRVVTGMVEGAAFTAVVASFLDPVPGGTANDYAATIDWGDGQTSLGAPTVDAVAAGGFNVTGVHTYAAAGSFPVAVTIMDRGGASASAASTALVADAPLTATGASLSATEGAFFSGVVATFTDADPNAAAGKYTATIDWGGGQTSPGTVTVDPLVAGRFDVIGGSTYAEEGTYAVTVVIADLDGATATATGTVVVSDALLVAAGTSVAATAGVPFTATVGTFIDANPGGAAGDFTATIDWGDGHTSPGTIRADGGSSNGASFSVTGTTTYAAAGSYTVSVTIADTGGAKTTAESTASVAAGPVATAAATGIAITAPPGTAFVGAVASLGGGATASQFLNSAVTITWGDGTSSAGFILPDPGSSLGLFGAATAPGFLVVGAHTYAAAGSFPVSVRIGGSANQVISTAHVGSAPVPAAILTFSGQAAPVKVMVSPTNTLTYSFTITNTGNAPATAVRLTARLPRVSPEMLEASTAGYRLPAAQLSWMTMLASLASPPASGLTHALRPELKDLRAPTLFVWGDKDIEPARLGQEMAALAPHARCEIVADAGHIVWLDQPERCSKLTIEFLKSG
ncbi:MAG: hypothetical protein ACLQBX_05515, partial [Candidatus Limnocylindrales bacterium]